MLGIVPAAFAAPLPYASRVLTLNSRNAMMPTAPPPLDDPTGYLAWRADKLARFRTADALRAVAIANVREPSPTEGHALWQALEAANLALIRCEDPAQINADDLLSLGRALGLTQLDQNPCANEQAVSQLEVRPRDTTGEYIPYTNRGLGWHTDGYYNPLEAAVRAWMLFCVRPAADGGENALLDPELVYIRLRDRDPELIAELMRPDAFCIPANVRDGEVIRAQTCGPVFAVREGRLLMRFTARSRNIHWHPRAAQARQALDELFLDGNDFILRHKLKAGEGYITRNVLHTRTPFTDAPGTGRLLLRLRYRDALTGAPHRVQADQTR